MKLNTPLKISIPAIISPEEIKVLTLLYQPLLGSGPYTLYLTLYELSNLDSGISSVYLHKELLDLLNIKISELLNYRHKLEALGLLVSYQGADDYVYTLKMPLTAKEFLNDTILGTFLQNEIGETNVKTLIKLFRLETIDLTNYNNKTKSFNEVYETSNTEIINFGNHLRGPSHNGGTTIKYDKFNYDQFIESIPVRYQRAHLFNQVVKDNIEKIAFVYQFENEDIKEIYLKSSQKGEMPSVEKLRLQAKLYYQSKEQQSQPEITEINQDLTVHLDVISPREIIKMYSKRDNISSDIDTALAFTSRSDVPLGVLNVILLYTIKEKEGLLPNVNYLEKVLQTWQNRGITTTKEALDFAEQLEKDTYRPSSHKKVKRAPEPEWLEEVLEEFKRR